MLEPAFTLQDRMQKSTLGEWEWVRILENISAAEQVEAFRTQHFGLLPTSAERKQVLGEQTLRFLKRQATRKRGIIDVHFVNSILPSRCAVLDEDGGNDERHMAAHAFLEQFGVTYHDRKRLREMNLKRDATPHPRAGRIRPR